MRKFPFEFIRKVRAEYPENENLHRVLESGETSIEWHLRQGAQLHLEAREVRELFEAGKSGAVYRAAVACIRRQALLEEYLTLKSEHFKPDEVLTRETQVPLLI